MVFEILPGQFLELAGPFAEEKKRAIERADAIIAISESTRKDLLAIYPELTQRVHVIHHGADHLAFSKNLRANSNHPEFGTKGYALFVGARSTYKNFGMLMESMLEPDWPENLDLKVAGAPFTCAEVLALKYRGLERRVVDCGRAMDSTLEELYAGASVFIFPSMFEGFGFPLLEAQAAGIPVAASDIAIFHEVGGKAFEHFQPLDPSSIARAVSRSLEHNRADELRQAGYGNVKRFKWADAAKKTMEVWKTLSR
jgi:glycosyltransferase involved in cell wall biosynthesis